MREVSAVAKIDCVVVWDTAYHSQPCRTVATAPYYGNRREACLGRPSKIFKTSKKSETFIVTPELLVDKSKKALERLNDAYEIGDYSRDEWLDRKKKREDEIYNLKKELYEIEKKEKENIEITDEDRLKNVKEFFLNVDKELSEPELNTLYKTIIDSIIWKRVGNDIDIKINFL